MEKYVTERSTSGGVPESIGDVAGRLQLLSIDGEANAARLAVVHAAAEREKT